MFEDMRKGDVLIFKAEEKWISKAIALLTGSDVSHAAMVYGDSAIVEMGLSGIMVNRIVPRREEEVYLLRLDPALDAGPLLEAARVYIEEKTIYDLPGLVLLGVLLVFRPVSASVPLLKAIGVLLKAAVSELDRLLNRFLYSGKDAMVCSQLVYQIYKDCGKPYTLKISGGVFQKKDENGICLADMLKEEEILEQNPAPRPEAADGEYAARMLCEAWENAAQQDTRNENAFLYAENLLPTASAFNGMLQRLLQAADMPMEALFVTPADLAYHTENLRLMGTAFIARAE